MNHREEEAHRRHDLKLNFIVSDGKWWRKPCNCHKEAKGSKIDISEHIKEIENWIINKQGRIIGRKDEIFGKHK